MDGISEVRSAGASPSMGSLGNPLQTLAEAAHLRLIVHSLVGCTSGVCMFLLADAFAPVYPFLCSYFN